MALYNLTAMSNATGYLSFIQKLNDNILEGQLGVIMLVIIFAIMMISLLSANANFGAKRSFLSAITVTWLLSLMMMVSGLVTYVPVLILAIMMAIIFAWSFYDG